MPCSLQSVVMHFTTKWITYLKTNTGEEHCTTATITATDTSVRLCVVVRIIAIFFLINDQNKQKVEREKDRGRSLDRVSNYFWKEKKEMHSFQISFLFTSAFMRNDERIAEGRRTIVLISRTSGKNSLFTNMRRIRMIGWKLQRDFMRRHVDTVQWSRNSK